MILRILYGHEQDGLWTEVAGLNLGPPRVKEASFGAATEAAETTAQSQSRGCGVRNWSQSYSDIKE